MERIREYHLGKRVVITYYTFPQIAENLVSGRVLEINNDGSFTFIRTSDNGIRHTERFSLDRWRIVEILS
jgi:hypothetical protein